MDAGDGEPLTGVRGWLRGTQLVPGGRQMLGAFVLALLGSVLLLFLPRTDEEENELPSLWEDLGGRGVLLVLIPVVIAAAPLAFLHHPRRRLAWNVATFLFGLWVLNAGLFYFIPLALMVWGLVKLSRSEGPRASMFGGRRRGPRPSDPAADDDRATP